MLVPVFTTSILILVYKIIATCSNKILFKPNSYEKKKKNNIDEYHNIKRIQMYIILCGTGSDRKLEPI